MRDAREESFNLVRTIKDVRQRMFVSQTGFQRNAPKALVIITDKNAGQDSRQVCKSSYKVYNSILVCYYCVATERKL